MSPATSKLPDQLSLPALREAAAGCRACDLYKTGTQTVFGEGAEHAQVMFVGEQPGDREDREGKPFVGPAGRVLDEALEAAGIDREHVYITNAVKHFKWKPQGKRRLHQKPNAAEINACRPWLDAEIAAVKPHLLVLLGASLIATFIALISAVKAPRRRKQKRLRASHAQEGADTETAIPEPVQQ